MMFKWIEKKLQDKHDKRMADLKLDRMSLDVQKKYVQTEIILNDTKKGIDNAINKRKSEY